MFGRVVRRDNQDNGCVLYVVPVNYPLAKREKRAEDTEYAASGWQTLSRGQFGRLGGFLPTLTEAHPQPIRFAPGVLSTKDDARRPAGTQQDGPLMATLNMHPVDSPAGVIGDDERPRPSLDLQPYRAASTLVLGAGILVGIVTGGIGVLPAWAGFLLGAIPVFTVATLVLASRPDA